LLIEHANCSAIFAQQFKGIVVGEILELDQDARERLTRRNNKLVYQLVVFGAAELKLIVPPPVPLRLLENIPPIGYNVGLQLVKGIRDALIASAEKFVAANPDIPLIHIGKTRSERRKARRRRLKKVPPSSSRKWPS